MCSSDLCLRIADHREILEVDVCLSDELLTLVASDGRQWSSTHGCSTFAKAIEHLLWIEFHGTTVVLALRSISLRVASSASLNSFSPMTSSGPSTGLSGRDSRQNHNVTANNTRPTTTSAIPTATVPN